MAEPRDPKIYATTDGQPPDPNYEGGGAPKPIDSATGQHGSYWILSAEERAKGFIRPVRQTYKHLKCGAQTTMGLALAETYARDPSFYGSTFCCQCRTHMPVGEHGEFVWMDGSVTTDQKVGT